MDIRQIISNQTDVSLNLTKNVIFSEAKNSNFIFSPLSLHVVLGLIASGSKGPTRDQLLGLLKSGSVEEVNTLSSHIATFLFADGGPLGGPNLAVANGLWVDQSLDLKPSFKEIVDGVHKAVTGRVDFINKASEVVDKVNTWVAEETNGLIKKILPPDAVDELTRLVLANAVYFKGVWNEKFDVSNTKDHYFFLLNGSTVQVPFMTSKKKQYICVFDDFKILRLPYKQGADKRRFSMYVFLPHAKDGLSALVEKIGSESGFIERHLPYEQVKVGDFRVPKFKIEFGFEASNILKEMGVVLAFQEGGLTEMVDNSIIGKKLFVSSIYHKSFIEVNEDGTEAAAATVAVIQLQCLRREYEFDFVADHPFLFIIREDTTGVVFFVGQVVNPL